MSTADNNDNIIQHMLEHGSKQAPPEIDRAQWEAYEVIFDALDQEPGAGLPYKFSARVIGEIQKREIEKEQFRNSLLAPVFIFVGLLLTYLILSAVNSEYATEIIKYVTDYKWFILFTVVSYLMVQLMDFRFVKKW